MLVARCYRQSHDKHPLCMHATLVISDSSPSMLSAHGVLVNAASTLLLLLPTTPTALHPFVPACLSILFFFFPVLQTCARLISFDWPAAHSSVLSWPLKRWWCPLAQQGSKLMRVQCKNVLGGGCLHGRWCDLWCDPQRLMAQSFPTSGLSCRL